MKSRYFTTLGLTPTFSHVKRGALQLCNSKTWIRSTFKTVGWHSFHYTNWLKGITVVDYYNPSITGYNAPLQNNAEYTMKQRMRILITAEMLMLRQLFYPQWKINFNSPQSDPTKKKNRACIAMVSLLALVVALKITQGDSQNHGFGPSSKPSTLHWAIHKLEWLDWFLANQLSLKRQGSGWLVNLPLPFPEAMIS